MAHKVFWGVLAFITYYFWSEDICSIIFYNAIALEETGHYIFTYGEKKMHCSKYMKRAFFLREAHTPFSHFRHITWVGFSGSLLKYHPEKEPRKRKVEEQPKEVKLQLKN